MAYILLIYATVFDLENRVSVSLYKSGMPSKSILSENRIPSSM